MVTRKFNISSFFIQRRCEKRNFAFTTKWIAMTQTIWHFPLKTSIEAKSLVHHFSLEEESSFLPNAYWRRMLNKSQPHVHIINAVLMCWILLFLPQDPISMYCIYQDNNSSIIGIIGLTNEPSMSNISVWLHVSINIYHKAAPIGSLEDLARLP